MKVYVAADHAGFALKKAILPFLTEELGLQVEDCGAHELDPSDDYPEIVAHATRAVSDAPDAVRAILFGKSGQGEAMVANRFPHVRAAVYYGGNPEIIILSREHNDANVLSLGAGFLSEGEAKDILRTWFATPFSEEERHVYRIRAIDEAASTHNGE